MIQRFTFLLFSMCLSLCSFSVLAQEQAAVLGNLLDSESGESLANASVALLSGKDSSFVKGALSSSTGRFRIMSVPTGEYFLIVRYTGYASIAESITLVAGVNQLGAIKLKGMSSSLDSVQITGKTPPVIQKGDTTQFDAKAFKTNPDASVQDLIQKMPGISVQDGKVQARGEQVTQVLVDGRPFFGDDPTAALKNLPASSVDKVEVFDKKSDQAQFTGFDDGNAARTINIVTKVEVRNGTFGRIYGGYGTDERYTGGGNVNIFNGNRRITLVGMSNNINEQNFSIEDLSGLVATNQQGGGGGRRRRHRRPGGPAFDPNGDPSDFLVGQQGGVNTTHSLGINYSDKIGQSLTMNGSYFVNQNNNLNTQLSNQTYFLSSETNQVYDETNGGESSMLNHRINVRMEYKINDQNSIIFLPRLSFQSYDYDGLLNSTGILTDAQSASFIDSLNSSSTNYSGLSKSYRIGGELLLRHKFAKRGRTISLGWDHQQNKTDLDSDLWANNSYYELLEAYNDTLAQEAYTADNGFSSRANLTYTEPLGKMSNLMLTYSARLVGSVSDKQTFEFEEQTNAFTALDSSLSSIFESEYLTQTAGAGIHARVGKKGFLMARLSYQNAQQQNWQQLPISDSSKLTFHNILPMGMFRLKVGDKGNFRTFFRASTQLPTAQELQEVVDNSNPLQLSMGNAELKQSDDKFWVMRYSSTNTDKRSNFSLFTMVRNSSDYIGTSTLFAAQDSILPGGIELNQGSQLSQSVNLDGYWNLRGGITYGFPLDFIKSNVNLSSGASLNKIPGLINGVENFSTTYTLTEGITISSNISEKLDFTLGYDAGLNFVSNSLQTEFDQNYFSHTGTARISWITWKGIQLKASGVYTYYQGLTDDISDPDFLLLSISLGKRVFKDESGLISLTAYDALKQNTSISRTVTETYIEDLNTQVLQQYFMLGFSWNIRAFKNADSE